MHSCGTEPEHEKQWTGDTSMAGGPNETDWAADRKVGFAMGILLIGVVAALFFRNEPLSVSDAPLVEREELIDARLRDRDISVYIDERDVSGDDADQGWTLPEILKRFKEQYAAVALPIGLAQPSLNSATADSKDENGSETFHGRPSVKPPSAVTDPAVPVFGRTPGTESLSFSDNVQSVEDFNAQPLQTDYVEYTVRYGDTLSRIADKLLGSSSRYQEIYDANRDRIISPDRLQVGAAIRIPRQ